MLGWKLCRHPSNKNKKPPPDHAREESCLLKTFEKSVIYNAIFVIHNFEPFPSRFSSSQYHLTLTPVISSTFFFTVIRASALGSNVQR
jgi:hypothetical protein